jgi:hypothetical protein
MAALALTGCGGSSGAAPQDRCQQLASAYGLTPCPARPLPTETPPIRNGDVSISDEQATRIAHAYLRSRELYYEALADNSDRFFHSRVIHVPDNTPLMFDAEIRHIGDARARRGRVVVRARSTVRSVTILPLLPDLRDAVGGRVAPMSDAVMVTVAGPDQEVIQAPGRADVVVGALGPGETQQQLIAGTLVTAPGLEETWAEVGQWDCHDPDVSRLCGVDSS